MTRFFPFRLPSIMVSLALLALLWTGCSSDVTQEAEIPCTDDELYDHVEDVCVPRYRGFADAGSEDVEPSEEDLVESEDTGTSTPDVDAADPYDPNCDQDGDGALAMRCGGNDCDDTARTRSPNHTEVCDTVDNDCNEQVNDGINCTFFAHSGEMLYAVDPFLKTATELGVKLENLQDIDTHPDGTLYGVTFDGLFRFDAASETWSRVGDFGINVEDPNGMAIDSEGTCFVTSQNNVYTVDLQTGQASLLGSMGEEYYSSGDCVVNKRDTLYMTSKHDTEQDHLVLIDRMDGAAREIGPIGFGRIFGLTAAWGRLYGVTMTGELLEIDSIDGDGTLIHTFESIRWFGAASTADR